MQSLVVLPQMFMQMLHVIYLPIFWITSIGIIIQIGYRVWHSAYKIWRQKQVVYWLPAFLFRVLEYYLSTMLIAIFGGTIASILLLLTGVSVDLVAIPYLWLIMMILFCMKRRFVCFAYAGGLLVLVQSLFGWSYFDGRQLMMMIAILHFTEAVLVYLNGASQSQLVYLRGRQGKTICRTQLQMIWPIPMVMPVPIHLTQTSLLQSGCMIMPEWWPILDTAMYDINTVTIYSIVPMLAVLGYQDDTECGKEHRHTKRAAILLFIYSVLLGVMVLASKNIPALLCVASLFAILGHEAIVRVKH